MSTVNPAEVIAEALAKHQLVSDARCSCGEHSPVWHPEIDWRGLHIAHQASVIAALPDIAIVPITAVELAHPTNEQIDDELKLCGFDPSERYPEYGHEALRTAWREGWDSANRPAGGES